MPAVVEQREHHGHWQGRGERRVASLSRDRSVYGRDSRVRADEDAEPEHGRIAASGSARRQARMGALSMIRSRAPISRVRMAVRTLRTKSASGSGAPSPASRACTAGRDWGCGVGHLCPSGKPQARARAGHAHNQSCISDRRAATAYARVQ